MKNTDLKRAVTDLSLNENDRRQISLIGMSGYNFEII